MLEYCAVARDLPYVASYKNVGKLFEGIAAAKQPDTFNHPFLADTLGIKGSADRPLIPLLRNLGFIDASNHPTPAYGELKNPSRRRAAVANGARTAYAPLFAANENADKLSQDDLKGLVAQVAGTDEAMTQKIVGTFNALKQQADFGAKPTAERQKQEEKEKDEKPPGDDRRGKFDPQFHYNINVHLPANGTEETYLNIFSALRRVPAVRHDHLAMFLMVGQEAERAVLALPEILPSEKVLIGPRQDLAPLMPEIVRRAVSASEPYRLFFVFENHLREFVVEALSYGGAVWWDKVPGDVQAQVAELEATEEAKSWMALGSRDKSALLTYPQLLRIIDYNWKDTFEEVVRDRGLLNQARVITHLRNTLCHMTEIPDEEVERVRQTMRDWFRIIAP